MRTPTWRRLTLSLAAVFGVAASAVLILNSPAGAARPLARAVLHNSAGAEVGRVVFEGRGHHADRVEIKLTLPADAPGLGGYHGLHVHTIGTCTAPAFTSAGGHWNLSAGATHGEHTGDLPSVLISPDGTARATFETHRFDVDQLFDSDGSAVVLHMGPDNFGNVPLGGGKYEDPNNWYNAPTGTANTGDAGSRYGCGVVRQR
jgi:superoxide dismutase, Cu-Zn family